MDIAIQVFENINHRNQVISLWQSVFGYEADHNEPNLVIDKKQAAGDGLFFVALDDRQVVGTVMAGYDGHRGWIYSLAVAAAFRKKGVGSCLLTHAEKTLKSMGCMKINLQIMDGNAAVECFYLKNGYFTEKRISMGKQVRSNIPG